jgi:predicted CDP-diglyceride synthetase/phosphatidate cytidylyltransferase
MNLIISIVSAVPELTLLVGVSIFILVCFANWHPTFRKKVNYYLSSKQKDEKQAYATAQGTIYGLNAILIPLAGLLILFSLTALGI